MVDLKSKLDEPAVVELIGLAVFPEPEHVERAVQMYMQDERLELLGYEEEGTIIGVIGFHDDLGEIELKHIAVIPEERGKGYGRGMLMELIKLKDPKVIVAETDEDAVDFYRGSGFTVESLGEKYPGAERFKCTYITDLDDAE